MINDPTGGKEFLGAGVAFPLGLDGEGRIAMNSLEVQVRQSILLILRSYRSCWRGLIANNARSIS